MSMPEMPMPETDVAELIRSVNATNNAVEDQCLRTRRAADAAIRSARVAEDAEAAAEAARVAHQTIQAERPRRRSPLPRQVILAAWTIALDGVACYFAAQALGGSQDSTLVWTVLFLAALAGGKWPSTTIETVTSASGGPWPSPSEPSYRFSAVSVSGSWPLSKMAAWYRRSPGLACSPWRRPGSSPWDTGHCAPPRRRRHGMLAGRHVRRVMRRGPPRPQRTETLESGTA